MITCAWLIPADNAESGAAVCGQPAVKSVPHGSGRVPVCQEHYNLVKGVREY